MAIVVPREMGQAVAQRACLKVGLQQAFADQLPDYLADPLPWFRDVLGCTLYPKQQDMVLAVRDNDQVSAVGCNSSGKDWTSARIALWWMATHEFSKVLITAPSTRQINDVIWKELRAAYLSAKRDLGGHLYETPNLTWDEHRFVTGFSTDKPYKLQGFHSRALLVIVSEAHGMKQVDIESLWKLNPLKVLYTGNPISESGAFYDSHHSKAALWQGITITAWDTPNVIEGRDVIPGLITRRDIRRHAENWGEDSPLYRMTVNAEWCEGMGQLIVVPLSWAVRAEVTEYPPGKVEVVGCDPAGRGMDKTVIYSRRGRVARLLWAVQGFSEMETAGWLKGYHDDHKFAHIVVDGVGLGSGIVSRLREQGVGVIDFQGGASASDSTRYADRNAEVWWRMRKAFDQGLDIDEQPELRAQLSSRKYNIESDKKVRLESKEDMRTHGRKSPDYADALAMTFALDWDVSEGARLSAESDVRPPTEQEAANREHERTQAESFGRGSDLAPWSSSRWAKVRGGRRR